MPAYLRLYFVPVLAIQPSQYRLSHTVSHSCLYPIPVFQPHVSRATPSSSSAGGALDPDNFHSHPHSFSHYFLPSPLSPSPPPLSLSTTLFPLVAKTTRYNDRSLLFFSPSLRAWMAHTLAFNYNFSPMVRRLLISIRFHSGINFWLRLQSNQSITISVDCSTPTF